MTNVLDRLRGRRPQPKQRKPQVRRDQQESPQADAKTGEPPKLPPGPYRSGLWGRIPSGDPDRG